MEGEEKCRGPDDRGRWRYEIEGSVVTGESRSIRPSRNGAPFEKQRPLPLERLDYLDLPYEWFPGEYRGRGGDAELKARETRTQQGCGGHCDMPAKDDVLLHASYLIPNKTRSS